MDNKKVKTIDLTLLGNLVGKDAKTIVEIGAHHGWHTNSFLIFFDQARIHAIEPDSRAIAMFNASVKSDRVTLYRMAIGSHNGETDFHVSSGDYPPDTVNYYKQGFDQSGSIRSPTEHCAKIYPWLKFEAKTRVPVETLDHWSEVHGIGDVDLIWADMQGAEGDLAQYGSKTLSRTRYIFVEYSDIEIYDGEPSLRQLLDLLPNFSVVQIDHADVLLRNNLLTT